MIQDRHETAAERCAHQLQSQAHSFSLHGLHFSPMNSHTGKTAKLIDLYARINAVNARHVHTHDHWRLERFINS